MRLMFYDPFTEKDLNVLQILKKRNKKRIGKV